MKSIIPNKPGLIQLKELKDHKNYNCKITTELGEEYLVYANWLHNEHLNNWQGWTCEAGATRLLIDKNFELYSGECKNDHLGSALGEFTIFDQTICRRERCSGCTDDLLVNKKAP